MLDDTQKAEFSGYAGFGFYLVDREHNVYAGPFRSRAAANYHLDELWEQRRTG
ncbi:hypothetical protein [Azorhizobium oxalatiphilum]|nr:hypothetical protein [Azorhizobium oxalatiphilum]